MKTAISIPDSTFERVQRSAQELGMSRSELFVRAAIAYLDDLEAASETKAINAALDLVGPDPEIAVVVAASKGRWRELENEW